MNLAALQVLQHVQLTSTSYTGCSLLLEACLKNSAAWSLEEARCKEYLQYVLEKVFQRSSRDITITDREVEYSLPMFAANQGK